MWLYFVSHRDFLAPASAGKHFVAELLINCENDRNVPAVPVTLKQESVDAR